MKKFVATMILVLMMVLTMTSGLAEKQHRMAWRSDFGREELHYREYDDIFDAWATVDYDYSDEEYDYMKAEVKSDKCNAVITLVMWSTKEGSAVDLWIGVEERNSMDDRHSWWWDERSHTDEELDGILAEADEWLARHGMEDYVISMDDVEIMDL